ncbi:YdcF family protein [Deinococcus cavernae]|uniref:YdcF family protein n=1 Tax=Deinococcus cavernae TaxID=2320857 RepID=A0A418V631_9DEIO|nr:YdcF family protein [Deinococcus cavernae]RJF71552.1 YdcF family protein [Deinococcus cavernae]
MRVRLSVNPVFPLLILGLLGAALMLSPLPRAQVGQPHSAVLVLGAAQYAGKPSPAFRRRLDHAYHLFEQGGVSQIVVTGGRRPGDPFTEGEVGVHYLASLGVPAKHLLAETRSRTTIENLRNAMTFLPPETPVTLVTDSAHAPRALALAHALGLKANVNPSPLSRSPDWRYLLREKIAFAAYALVGVKG